MRSGDYLLAAYGICVSLTGLIEMQNQVHFYSNSTTSCILSVDGTLINHCLILACFSTFSLGAEQGTLVVGLVAFVRLF